MKLLAVVFVTAISISCNLSSSTPLWTCPAGYKERAKNVSNSLAKCIEDFKVGPVCPVVEGKNEGDRCVVSSKHCPSGYHLLGDHQTCIKEDEKRLGKYGCDIDYLFDKLTGYCSKVINKYIPHTFCQLYFDHMADRCIGRPHKPFEECQGDSNLPKGCKPKRVYNSVDGRYENWYWRDNEDPRWAVLDPDHDLLWCHKKFYLNPETNMCESLNDGPEEEFCYTGDAIDGICIETEDQLPMWTCSPKPEPANRTIGKVKLPAEPILTCFEGIIGSGVCKITRNVQPVIGCPKDYTADSDGKNCKPLP